MGLGELGLGEIGLGEMGRHRSLGTTSHLSASSAQLRELKLLSLSLVLNFIPTWYDKESPFHRQHVNNISAAFENGASVCWSVTVQLVVEYIGPM